MTEPLLARAERAEAQVRAVEAEIAEWPVASDRIAAYYAERIEIGLAAAGLVNGLRVERDILADRLWDRDQELSNEREECAAAEARVSELTLRLGDAHAFVAEAQRLAYDLLTTSGATRVEHEQRTPEQVAMVTLYSLIHDAVKRLAGRGDIEMPTLDDAKLLVIEYRQTLADTRAERDQIREQRDQALTLLADAIPDPKGAIDPAQWHQRMDWLAAWLSAGRS